MAPSRFILERRIKLNSQIAHVGEDREPEAVIEVLKHLPGKLDDIGPPLSKAEGFRLRFKGRPRGRTSRFSLDDYAPLSSQDFLGLSCET